MAFKKLLMAGDAATELTGAGYKLLLVSNGAVAELAHGASGAFLKSSGSGADPVWDEAPVDTLDAIGDVDPITEAQGQVIFRSATAWDALGPGEAGYFLKTQGAAADPVWAAISVPEDSIGATEIDESDTAIEFAQIILTPVSDGVGVAEGTLYFDAEDKHFYGYVA